MRPDMLILNTYLRTLPREDCTQEYFDSLLHKSRGMSLFGYNREEFLMSILDICSLICSFNKRKYRMYYVFSVTRYLESVIHYDYNISDTDELFYELMNLVHRYCKPKLTLFLEKYRDMAV